jgi:hypothetical protein
MSSIKTELDSTIHSQFNIHCELDSYKKIKNFSLNNSAIFQNGKLIDSNLSENEILSNKLSLENIFENLPSSSKFKIENQNGKLFLKPQTWISRIIPINQSVELSAQTAGKLQNICSQIENRKQTNSIFSKVKTNNLAQLEDIPKTNRKLTALFLGLIVIGFLSAVIGVGALLPQLGLISTKMGIAGIPFNIAISLVSIGIATIGSIVALNIASKKSIIANEYLKDILKLKGEMFLEGNGNDFTNGCLFLLLALTTLNFAGLETLKGCLAYPTGILIIMSATYQAIQSFKNMTNAKQTKDNEKLIKSILSLCFAASLFTLGVLTTIGMSNTPIQTIFMFTTGTLMLSLAGFGMKKSYEMLKEVNEVNEKNAVSIINFLDENLSLKEDEIKKIKNSISNFKTEDILNWISQNSKNWEIKQKEIWEEIHQRIQNNKDIEIEEAKKLIINEEIKNAIERKLDSFRSLVREDTYKKALNALNNFKDNPNANESDLIELFKEIKSEIRIKTIAETIKFFLLYIPYMFFPALNMNGLIDVKIYDLIIAALNFLSLSINSTPRFRNVPPAIEKKPLDINDELDSYKKINAVVLKKLNSPKETVAKAV